VQQSFEILQRQSVKLSVETFLLEFADLKHIFAPALLILNINAL